MKKKIQISLILALILTAIIYLLNPKVEGYYRTALLQKLHSNSNGFLILKNNIVYGIETDFEKINTFVKIGKYYKKNNKYFIDIENYLTESEIKPTITHLNCPEHFKDFQLSGEPLTLEELSRLINPIKKAKLNTLIEEKMRVTTRSTE